MSLFEDKSLEITGKIDRVDLGKIGDKQYVRVIDYKSSNRDLDKAGRSWASNTISNLCRCFN